MIIEEIAAPKPKPKPRLPRLYFDGTPVEIAAVGGNTIYLDKPIKPRGRFAGLREVWGCLSCSASPGNGPIRGVRWLRSNPDELLADGLMQDFRNGDEEAAEFLKALRGIENETI